MRSFVRVVLTIAVVFSITNCAFVPPLQEDGIAISSIVQRIKCELAFAMPEPRPPYPTGPYQWMADWTAKVDLTLITNDQSAITPTAAFVNPLRTETVPLVGTVARNFTLSAGAGLTNNAIRNETMSFTLSIAELRNQKYRGNCDLSDGFDLYGNLGLKEWVESALTPVDRNMLTIGKHTAPGAKPATAPQFAVDSKLPDQIHQAAVYADLFATKAANAAKSAESDAEKYKKDTTDAAPAVIRNDMQLVFNQVENALTAAKQAMVWADKVTSLSGQLTDDDKRRLTPDQQKTLAQDLKDGPKAKQTASTAETAANAIWKGIPQDSPIDSIGHQVQFIVVASANATPSWTLVHFKGPGTSGTFGSLMQTRTHTLNIALGAPSGAVNASQEQLRTLNNLQLDTLVPLNSNSGP
jgi:hypothetical protein